MKCIAYRAGNQYQLKQDYSDIIPITPPADIDIQFSSPRTDGSLVIRNGYAWDGPSAPTIDTQNFMRGSLVHDALYQLMRERHLDRNTYREPADRFFRQIAGTDGMSAIRAWWVYQGVRFEGGPTSDPALDKPLTHVREGCP